MLSESARATSGAESRFRVAAPNSRPRSVRVVALGATSERFVMRLAGQSWSGARFLSAAAFAGGPHDDAAFCLQGWLTDLTGRTGNLIDELAQADLVVMVALAGESADAAALIAEACEQRRIMTTALVVGTGEAVAATLAQLRPFANMVVAAVSADYVADMLLALRA